MLLHHGLGSTRSWRKQVPALAEAGYRVIVYDRWGYGQSEARPYLEVPSFRDDLADLESILSTFRSQSTTLIGHSDGGTIALYWAAQHPEQVASLVTIAAHIYLEPKMEPGIQAIQQTFEQDEEFIEQNFIVHMATNMKQYSITGSMAGTHQKPSIGICAHCFPKSPAQHW